MRALSASMGLIFELIRIIAIFGILGYLFGEILSNIYVASGVNLNHYFAWVGFTAIYLLIFVLYRNKFQFSGWYKGKNSVKLSKTVTLIVVYSSIFLMLLPIINVLIQKL